MNCEGTRQDGSRCNAPAGRRSTFCRYHETGLGPGLRLIEEGRSPHDGVVPSVPMQPALFNEEDLEASPDPGEEPHG